MNGTSMDRKNRIFLITGGTSGVGKATALGLARLGAKIVIIGRSSESGQNALHAIAKATGNERGEVLVADLSLQSSIRKVSEEFKRKYDNLHVLANLAGAMYFEKQLTQEGRERMFAVNYLSHFLLTNQLLDMLKESRPSRVLTVAGAPRFLKHATINFEDIQLEKQFSGLRAAAQAMFARTLFTFELAKRLDQTGVTAVAFHPGLVKSNLLKTAQNVPWFLKVMAPFMQALAKDECEIGVYLAASREFEKVNGVFFNESMQIVPLVPFHTMIKEDMGRKLWSISEELTGLSTV